MLVRFDGQRWKANLVRQSDCWATSVTERTQDCTNRLVGFAYLPDRGDVPISCYGGFADSTAKEPIATADDELPLRCRSCRHGGMLVEEVMDVLASRSVLDSHLDLQGAGRSAAIASGPGSDRFLRGWRPTSLQHPVKQSRRATLKRIQQCRCRPGKQERVYVLFWTWRSATDAPSSKRSPQIYLGRP